MLELSTTPAQMLVVTYEAASVDMQDPYFTARFAPLKPVPVHIYGRYAEGEQTCTRSHAIWYAWKDRTSSQHDSDFLTH